MGRMRRIRRPVRRSSTGLKQRYVSGRVPKVGEFIGSERQKRNRWAKVRVGRSMEGLEKCENYLREVYQMTPGGPEGVRDAVALVNRLMSILKRIERSFET